MEHHYSLTGRMLAIFWSGLVLLGILIFAAGLLIGREWGAIEEAARAIAAQRSRLNPAPSAAPLQAPPAAPAAVPLAPAGGGIRPADALPPLPAAPAVPAPPAVPKPPPVPAAPAIPALPPLKSSGVPPAPATEMARSSAVEATVPRPAAVASAAPVIPARPPLKSSGASPDLDTEMARSSAVEASIQRPAEVESAAPAKPGRAKRGNAKVHGFVVYVGAFENGATAKGIAEELRDRGLAAKTSLVKKPGRKPLVTVWIGPFDARAGAESVLPGIRAAGLQEAMIREVP